MRAWTMTRRLLGVLIALISGLWLAGVGLAAMSIQHEINEVFDSALQETAQRILPLALDDLDEHRERLRDREGEDDGRRLSDPLPAEEHKEHLLYQIREAGGHVILRSHDAPAGPFAAPLQRGFFDGDGRRYYTEVSRKHGIYVQVAELPGERQQAINAIGLGLAAPLLGLLPLAAFAIYQTVRRTTRPIELVKEQIRRRDGEHLDPIDAHGLPGELTPIIHDMNRLLERLKAALEAERSFAANSAHELRNPIAAARAQAELIAAVLKGSPEHARATQLVATLGQLGRRIERILQLARAEAGLGFGRTQTDLLAVARLVVDDYGKRASPGSRLTFDPGPVPSLDVAADPDAIGIALQNLIDNALSHGPQDAAIEIRIGPGAAVSVTNGGPIVGQEELVKLRQRFARGGDRSAPGSGLGLSIVDEIMQQAGGRLELYSPARGRPDGFEAVLEFPRTRSAP